MPCAHSSGLPAGANVMPWCFGFCSPGGVFWVGGHHAMALQRGAWSRWRGPAVLPRARLFFGSTARLLAPSRVPQHSCHKPRWWGVTSQEPGCLPGDRPAPRQLHPSPQGRAASVCRAKQWHRNLGDSLQSASERSGLAQGGARVVASVPGLKLRGFCSCFRTRTKLEPRSGPS